MSRITKRITRLFKLLALLETGWYNIPALEVELRVSERQVFRDIVTLRSQGFAIVPNSTTGNYVLLSPVTLPEMQFELDEIVALIALCNTEGNQERIPAARRAAMKLQNALPRDLQAGAGFAEKILTILPEPITMPVPEFRGVFDVMLESLREKRSLRISYKSPVEAEIETILEPYWLFFCRHAWYVIAREPRTFHLGRIIHFEKMDRYFKIPVGFTLQQYLGNAWRMIREPGPDQKVTVRFTPLVAQNVAEVYWHPTQRVVWNEDGSMDYTVTVSGLNEISWWILGYGREAKVLRPVKLQKMIQKHATDMLKQYEE